VGDKVFCLHAELNSYFLEVIVQTKRFLALETLNHCSIKTTLKNVK